jgi:1-acyl-sn-glycerol-3-phosphate acyltransferase
LGRIHVEGAERLTSPGSLVVANHPTLIDVVALIAYMPQADCVVKQANFDNPFMRGMLRGAGYLPNSAGPKLVEECVRRLRSGRSLVLFPEGTRSPEKGLGRMQRGAAHVALEAGCDLIPVVITCDPPALMKGVPWWIVPDRTFDLRLRVGEPLSLDELVARKESRAIAARALTARLRELFEKGMADAGS